MDLNILYYDLIISYYIVYNEDIKAIRQLKHKIRF